MSVRNHFAVGWREWVTFPDFGTTRVKAKIDTGARTSAIHAVNITTTASENGDIAHFELHPNQDDDVTTVICTAPIIDRRMITDSGGHSEKRLVVETAIQIGEHIWPIELTLTDRDSMGFRMLIGRHAIRKKFVVFPGRSYLAGIPLLEVTQK